MRSRPRRLCFWLLVSFFIGAGHVVAGTYEIRPAVVGAEEEFERRANALQPGDELVLHGGTYSQNGRRAVTAKGTVERPIIISRCRRRNAIAHAASRPAEQH
jgi:hypothetical protein